MSLEALDSFDDDDLRLRNIANIFASSPFTPTTPTLAPPRSHLSSIAPVAPREPALAAPQQNMMYKILGSHRETERITTKAANVFEGEIAKSMADVEKLSAERQEALENEARNVKSRATWSTLSTVAQYISGASMIALGFAAGGVPAFLLVTAGIIGIGNRVLHDTNLLQAGAAWLTKSEELQQKYIRYFEMTAFILQMGLGLAGGFAAWYTGALGAAQITNVAIKDKLKSIIAGASGILSVGGKIGTAYYDKKIAYIHARMKEIEADTNINNLTMYNDSIQMSKMVESTQSQTDEIRKAIQAIQIHFD